MASTANGVSSSPSASQPDVSEPAPATTTAHSTAAVKLATLTRQEIVRVRVSMNQLKKIRMAPAKASTAARTSWPAMQLTTRAKAAQLAATRTRVMVAVDSGCLAWRRCTRCCCRSHHSQ